MVKLKLQYFGHLFDGKSRLIGKDPDAGKDWGQEEKWAKDDEMVGWHHRLNGHESPLAGKSSPQPEARGGSYPILVHRLVGKAWSRVYKKYWNFPEKCVCQTRKCSGKGVTKFQRRTRCSVLEKLNHCACTSYQPVSSPSHSESSSENFQSQLWREANHCLDWENKILHF